MVPLRRVLGCSNKHLTCNTEIDRANLAEQNLCRLGEENCQGRNPKRPSISKLIKLELNEKRLTENQNSAESVQQKMEQKIEEQLRKIDTSFDEKIN